MRGEIASSKMTISAYSRVGLTVYQRNERIVVSVLVGSPESSQSINQSKMP